MSDTFKRDLKFEFSLDNRSFLFLFYYLAASYLLSGRGSVKFQITLLLLNYPGSHETCRKMSETLTKCFVLLCILSVWPETTGIEPVFCFDSICSRLGLLRSGQQETSLRTGNDRRLYITRNLIIEAVHYYSFAPKPLINKLGSLSTFSSFFYCASRPFLVKVKYDGRPQGYSHHGILRSLHFIVRLTGLCIIACL